MKNRVNEKIYFSSRDMKKVEKLRGNRCTWEMIGKEFNCSHSTIWKAYKDYKENLEVKKEIERNKRLNSFKKNKIPREKQYAEIPDALTIEDIKEFKFIKGETYKLDSIEKIEKYQILTGYFKCIENYDDFILLERNKLKYTVLKTDLINHFVRYELVK